MSNILDRIINTVTVNGMREITVERAKQIAIEYAREVAIASLEKASVEVKMKIKKNIDELSMMDDWSEIDRESITNPDNIVIL